MKMNEEKEKAEKQQAFSFTALTRIFQAGHKDIGQNARTETLSLQYVKRHQSQEGRLYIFSFSFSVIF